MYIYGNQPVGPRGAHEEPVVTLRPFHRASIGASIDSRGQRVRFRLWRPDRARPRPIGSLGYVAALAAPGPTVQEEKLARSFGAAIELARSAIEFARKEELTKKVASSLRPKAQRDLLKALLDIASNFFPAGYGLMDEDNKVIVKSVRPWVEASYERWRTPSIPFRYEVQMFLSRRKSDFAAGDHNYQESRNTSQIRFYVNQLARASVNSLGSVLIHEMAHMIVSLRQSLEAREGKVVADAFPTKDAAAILNINKFVDHGQVLERHFSTLLNHLERQHGIIVRYSVQDRTPALLIAEMAIEEVIAYVFDSQVSNAMAAVEASRAVKATGKPGVALAHGFEPTGFLKNYLRYHWISGPKVEAAFKTQEVTQILKSIEPDLLKLVRAVESNLT
jgi:hypothetical protein